MNTKLLNPSCWNILTADMKNPMRITPPDNTNIALIFFLSFTIQSIISGNIRKIIKENNIKKPPIYV
jgi:fucose permease